MKPQWILTVKQLLFASEKIFCGVCESPIVVNISCVYKPLLYDCNNNTGLFKAYLQKLVVANQFVCSKSRNNVVLNKSWFTVHFQVIYGPHIVYNHHPLNLIGWER